MRREGTSTKWPAEHDVKRAKGDDWQHFQRYCLKIIYLFFINFFFLGGGVALRNHDGILNEIDLACKQLPSLLKKIREEQS